MKRPTKSPSLARLIGVMLTIGLYLAVLVAATMVTGAADTPGAGEPAAAVTAIQAGSESQASEGAANTESPVLTLAIAAAALAIAGAGRLARVVRHPRAVPVPIGRRRMPTTG
jgi:hypothetical protein